MANRSAPQLFESESEYVVVEGLTSWEFINPSDDDEVADHFSEFSLDEQDLASTDDDDVEEKDEQLSSVPAVEDDDVGDVVIGPKEGGPDANGSSSSGVTLHSLIYSFALQNQLDQSDFRSINRYHPNDRDDDDEEEDWCYDENELDDELVPMSVKGRFGRERMRKLGKRGYPRMYKSKKLPYYYNRPGCVHGKHGLGVQHSFI